MSPFNESLAAGRAAGMRSGSVIGFCLFLFLMTPVAAKAQAKARWISSTQLITKEGLATLRWSVDGIEAIALFRLREEHSGECQISYTDQTEIDVVREEPGDYSFWVQACRRYADGYPHCGESSQRLTLSVIETEIYAPSPAKATSDPTEPKATRRTRLGSAGQSRRTRDPKGRSKEAEPLRVSEAQAGGSRVTFAAGETRSPEFRRAWEHDGREKVRPGTGREAGLGHAGSRATQGAVAEGSETPESSKARDEC